ncbi:methyl-accepting chemotaxis protein [Sphingomonas echinoides]|uniref:methyl-accepting chemotaxis protein n=1 Tax=Sphingomonas echinoides TaxID=59803 RepID=UPI0024135425|nr:methyl-accepting chemotaxis protein [Sphingomonas echinoides]
MNWFRADAPIRLKMLVSYGTFVALLGITTLSTVLLPSSMAVWVALGATGVGVVLAHLFREAVCVPYVSTVVRMEGLAAGDLETPIDFTDYKDCVGRMTKAMFAFRATAQAQLTLNEEAEINSQIIRRMADNFGRLSNCDLTADIVEEYPPVYAPLKASFNDALGNLRALLGSVMTSTGNIQTGSSEIAQASDDLARRTESNAASLEQTAAAIQQVDSRLKATARAATQSVETSEQAKVAVLEGRSRTDVAVQAMTRVMDSAKGIDDVIEGLDKIAFQTRVLAMNAAVEAGRAGDAGRGFAVVADLVSALAMRAEEESKRARDQLSATRVDIGAAVDAVQKVDDAFGVILTSGEQAAQLAEQIASDNAAQASAITEVSTAVHAMDQSTQQNAAMVEQTSAAARNLSEEVVQLAAQADRFRVEPARHAYA